MSSRSKLDAPIVAGHYQLSPEVYVCLAEGQAIFLDLKRDKYVGLGVQESAAIAASVSGWPQVADDISARVCAEDRSKRPIDELLGELESNGLLTLREDCADPVPQGSIEPATSFVSVAPGRIDVRLTLFCTLLRAYISARMQLRRGPFDRVVRNVYRRKQEALGRARQDGERLHSLVGSFMSARPLLYTAQDACLLDSLALIEFLARYAFYPTWVIAVRTGPFGAHSWVQDGRTVLNDTTARVLRYTPILAI